MLALLAGACGGGEQAPARDTPAPAGEPLRVAATSPFAAWLAESIGGDDVQLYGLPPAGVDPHTFAPSAEQILALGGAELIVVQGAGYETWREGASLPESRVVDLSQGLDLVAVEGRTHSHGAEGEHSHTGTDPATWMDPALVASQARRMLTALEAASPRHGPDFLARGHALETELDRFASRLDELRDTLRVSDVAVAGQSGRYAYLARALGVELLPLEAELDDHAVGHLRRAVGTRRLIVLWPSAPAPELLSRVPSATIWVEVDPLEAARPSGGYDYLERMSASLGRLEHALRIGGA
jgi:zinc transport system substrate-binding protein